MCPEIVGKKDYTGPPVDMWAFGILCYVILCGKYPFKGYNERDLFKKILYGRYYWPSDIKISPEAQSMVKSLLQINPRKRASIQQILK